MTVKIIKLANGKVAIECKVLESGWCDLTTQEVLEWCAAFAFLHVPHDEEEWYHFCVEEYCKYQDKNQQIALFWWSLRDFYPTGSWIGWRNYLIWKNNSMGLNLPINKDKIHE
jgi:hypothetical protein